MPTITLTNADNGRTIEAREGDEIVLQLPENPTTGYRWHVDRVEGALEPEAESRLPEAAPSPPDPNVQFGRGGVRELRFRAVAPGTARLELKHWQAWEGERSVVERFALDVTLGRSGAS